MSLRVLRSDERGSLTLLAGMMVFLVTVFGIIAFDTNMAIYNRMVAQNAVDSAADSAALWQARGCNVLQNLNNLHYDTDYALGVGEDVAAGACIAAAVVLAAEAVADIAFGAGEVSLRGVRIVLCIGCAAMPMIDGAQQQFYKAIMPIERTIASVWPYIAFANANAAAKGCGADTLGAAASGQLQGMLGMAGINIPGASSLAGLIGGVPLYTMPLDPKGFGLIPPADPDSASDPVAGLGVYRRGNNGWPLNQSSAIGKIGQGSGYAACSDTPTPLQEWESNARNWVDWDSNYGWNDDYYFGWPGFNTWIAGKGQQNEVLGGNFGNLAWMNGGRLSSDDQENAKLASQSLYVGSSWASAGAGFSGPITIPGHLAVASSQVQGTVVCHDTSDWLRGYLIKVYFPSSGGGKPTSGEQFPFYIYH
jgi:hypothetical protein